MTRTVSRRIHCAVGVVSPNPSATIGGAGRNQAQRLVHPFWLQTNGGLKVRLHWSQSLFVISKFPDLHHDRLYAMEIMKCWERLIGLSDLVIISSYILFVFFLWFYHKEGSNEVVDLKSDGSIFRVTRETIPILWSRPVLDMFKKNRNYLKMWFVGLRLYTLVYLLQAAAILSSCNLRKNRLFVMSISSLCFFSYIYIYVFIFGLCFFYFLGSFLIPWAIFLVVTAFWNRALNLLLF